MKKIVLAIVLILGAGILFNSCKHDPDSIVIPPGTSGGVGTAVCFESEVLPLLQTNCAKSGCHDAATHADDYVLDNYTNIMKKGVIPGNATNSKIYEVLFENGNDKMPPPPNADLTSSQKALIGRWINEGAKNTVNCATACDTTQFRYGANISQILATHCLGCHAGPSSSAGIDLSSYGNVRPYAINGKLVGAVTHSPGYSAMPKNAGKLSDCQIRQIQKWVAGGSPNN